MAGVIVHLGACGEDAEAMARDWALLDDAERAQAARYHQPVDRARFVARRGGRRRLLAAHLGVAPEGLRFGEGAYGKPVLLGHELQFSTSHAGDDWVLAVADVPLGCDLARLDPGFAWREVARAFFAAVERKALDALAPEEAPAAFLEVWARKEAMVKALGHGLSFPLDAFIVADGPGAPYQAGVAGWQAAVLWPRPGLCVAITVQGDAAPQCRLVQPGETWTLPLAEPAAPTPARPKRRLMVSPLRLARRSPPAQAARHSA
ncbi:4'-phosphopantetheinyl transferase superfamily protein [Sphingomonas sp.]|uniref:4'-phosphopantetheinyl transferase family protein n=1 Tax=Sphingomonas sp. TaxID=28214 RepID=UPI001DF7D5BE|nr:4'-phosphopantetheinyl transferase superfamily protein [Sphingomonas sp.]MBX9797498.1 4'-phosphopantetheinyl transferase superfamily protein [Sphingomonas sp.]